MSSARQKLQDKLLQNETDVHYGTTRTNRSQHSKQCKKTHACTCFVTRDLDFDLLTQFNCMQITPCLPFIRKRSPDGATPT